MNEGDVLVAETTAPELIVACKKAGAIVTDMGGMMSHAAIVSREFGIPCIVGTQNASRILKDGDLVEVDANSGLVRVIHKAGIDPDSYQHFGMWKCNPFAEYFWVSWFDKNYLSELGIDISESGVLVLNGGHFFVKKSVVRQAAQFIEGKINSSQIDFFDDFVNFANNLYKTSLDRSNRALEIKDDKDFINEIAEIGKGIMFPWFVGWLFCEVYESHLEQAAAKNGISSDKISEYIPLISTPLMEQQGELRVLKQDLLEKGIWETLKTDPHKVVEYINQDVTLASVFNDHLKKYAWIQILNFLGDDITLENLLDQMTHLSDQENRHEKAPAPSSFEYHAIVSSRLSYLRQTGAEYFSIYTQIVLPKLKKIAYSLGLSHREILEFLPSEINKLLSNTVEPARILDRRQNDNWCVYADMSSELQIIDDKKQVDVLVKSMAPKLDENQDIIKGQVGNKGIATGKVKVILANTEFDKMEVGDVLVTTMTTPDFVILMQKASAIVTDIGGLLCHAAIVSRELNKPCVIGTKFATQLLQDGMEVEVDADNGIIRIL
jgi:phosphohistidine swiveling domain-containing protein